MKQKLITTSIRVAAVTTVIGLVSQTSSLAFASSWNPTLLVNTESFSTIDDGDGTTNIEIRFGDTVDERVYWDVTRDRFDFTDDIHVMGNISGSGTLTISGATTLDSTLSVSGAVTFDSQSLSIGGVSYTFPGADGGSSGNVLATDGAGGLSWSEALTKSEADADYVNVAGDTMTGQLIIANGAGLTASGNIDASGTLTIEGAMSGDTITVSGDATVGGELSVTDDATFGSGISVTDDAVFGSGISLNGVMYMFPGADGAASGKVLKTDSNGNLSWSDDIDTNTQNPDQNLFETFAVDGQSSVVADTTTDTLTFATGTNITITTNAGTDTITIAAPDAVSVSQANDWYVNVSGDTMTGQLVIANGFGLTASGNIDGSGTLSIEDEIKTASGIIINKDGTAQDAVLTFGNDAGNEWLLFSDTTNQFEFSDDLQVTGAIHATQNLSASGNLIIEGSMSGDTLNVSSDADVGGDLDVQGNMSGDSLTVSSTGVSIGGVQYYFTNTQGGANEVLQNDGNGNLTWASPTVADGSGDILFLSPEYPHAVYFFSGSTYVGQLSASGSVSEGENFYYWETSKNALNDYWVSTRIRVPDNFSSWDPSTPIQFRYQTSNASVANSYLKVEMLDTAGSIVPLTSGDDLANTSWTTADITGPESTGTYTPGGYITVFVKLAAIKNHWAKAGWLELNWETTTP